jgi:peptidoglycan/xylan/chitin deacetylase (PgdA/CDA1 family)
MYLAKTPDIIKPLAGDLLWNLDRNRKEIYLTFDDGPTPGVTTEVLDILDQFKAKATFFCIGGNVKTSPGIFQRTLEQGHAVGNHTWNHMSGWEYSDFSYFKNILECGSLIKSNLFRPPYGRIKRSQAKGLKKRFTIVMWDVLSADWDSSVSHEKCLNNVIQNAQSGSIVVFHDSIKASKNMRYALPRVLDHFKALGYEFKALPQG